MKKFTFITLFIIVILSLGYLTLGKQSNNNTTENNKLKVVASFYPMYFFSSEIGKDKVEVVNITPAGSEPHSYEITAQDAAKIENSNLLVVLGGVETWEERIKDNLKNKKTKIIAVGEGLFAKETEEEHDHHSETEDNDGHDHGTLDPHIWTNPVLAKKISEKIANAYISVDPKNTEYYKKNEQELSRKLDELNLQYQQGLSNCQIRTFVTSHAAFAYLAKQYNLTQIPISGISPEEEPSAQKLTEIANLAEKNNIKYIFFESLVSPKLSETIAKEIGAKTLVLDPVGGISENDIQKGKNYFTVMQNNLKNLQTALQCSN